MQFDYSELSSLLGVKAPLLMIDSVKVLEDGTAEIVSYTGEAEYESIPSVLDGYVIKVIKPRFNISTKEAYSKVKPMIPKTSLVEDFKRPVREWQGLIKNDFEASVFPEHPELQRYKDLLYESGALYASMTGSGSALFGIFDHEPVLRGEIAELMVD